MPDVLIIGGGVIGLSLAWDLARHGRSVHVIDRGEPGREASWAGAGILPPAGAGGGHPYDELCRLTCRLHPDWAAELTAVSGIDNGYRRCGGLYLARTPGEAAALAAWAADQRAQGVAVQPLTLDQLVRLEPGAHSICHLHPSTRYSVLSTECSLPTRPRQGIPAAHDTPTAAYLLPEEAQLRNPRHVQALLAACQRAGVEITANLPAGEVCCEGGRIRHVETTAGPLAARRYCFTAGAWTGQLLAALGIPLSVLPIRGQMVLFRCHEPPTRRIINLGSRYIVPRDDGRVLAGSTEEEVGFDKRTTEEAIRDLTRLACQLVPALADAEIEQSWAGLRPASFDGLPYLGPLPGLANGYVAAGHFRSGLYLSSATAVVMSQLLRDEQPQIDLSPFRVGR